jgi:hypothetical protein
MGLPGESISALLTQAGTMALGLGDQLENDGFGIPLSGHR